MNYDISINLVWYLNFIIIIILLFITSLNFLILSNFEEFS